MSFETSVVGARLERNYYSSLCITSPFTTLYETRTAVGLKG